MPYNRRRSIKLALCLLSICIVRSDTGEIQPSNHGLPSEKDPGDPSPAMATFFGGRPAAAPPLPVQGNTTDPVWGVAGKVSPEKPESRRWWRRMLLLIAGVCCGILGVVFLVAAAAYTVRTRRTGRPAGLRTGFGMGSSARPSRLKNRPETRLEAA